MDDSQSEKECDYSFDGINNLPQCMKEKILEYLPIKDAVRTCILSKDWSHTWSEIHNLHIDVSNNGSNCRQLMVPRNEEDLRNITFIDQVLNLHNGNVHTLKISGAKPSQGDFERWMLKLSKMQIKKLILKLDCERSWRLRPHPACQISGICAIKLPEDFNGLKLLQSLHFFGECKINETDMTKLISSCPLLEELKLYLFSYRVLKIYALNLQRMSIAGHFGDLHLQTPKLEDAFIFIHNFKKVPTSDVIVGRSLLSSLSHIQDLAIYPDYLIGSLQAKNPPMLSNLICLHLYLRPSDAELTFMLLLLRNSPKLYELRLSSRALLASSFLDTDEQHRSNAYEELESKQQGLFPCLRRVLIEVDLGSDFLIAFAKFILNNTPLLEELTIWGDMEDLQTLRGQMSLKDFSIPPHLIFLSMLCDTFYITVKATL